jgi:transcription elongation factor GreA
VNDDLTRQDIEKMQAEIEHRKYELMPGILEEVKRTRAFGDLSENYEYKAAKQEQRRNMSRIRYLERMIATAHVIEDSSSQSEAGLYDKIELRMVEDQEDMTIRVTTTVRCDPALGYISKESPLGRAVLGRRVGERVSVVINENTGYTVEILSIEKGQDDGDAPLMPY